MVGLAGVVATVLGFLFIGWRVYRDLSYTSQVEVKQVATTQAKQAGATVQLAAGAAQAAAQTAVVLVARRRIGFGPWMRRKKRGT